MGYDNHLTQAIGELRAAQAMIQDELRAYPTPVSGCDAQFNHLVGQRNAIGAALAALAAPPFVATPRTPTLGAGVESR
ncbi:MAG: hypothetical protein AAFR47_16080 [Pseudomonadota bacterium]